MSQKKIKRKVGRSKKKITHKTARKPAAKRGQAKRTASSGVRRKKKKVSALKPSRSRKSSYSKKLQKIWKPEFWIPTVFAAAALIVFGLWVSGDWKPLSSQLTSFSRISYGGYTSSGLSGGTLLENEFKKASKMKLAQRLSFWSQKIQKNRRHWYVQWTQAFAPLMPRIKDKASLVPKKFNCTTYIETVAALAKSKNANQFYDHLMAIRYKNGRATFGSRNHFPSGDWIPNNVSSGHLKDVTQMVANKAGVDLEYESKNLNKKNWVDKQLKKGRISRGLASFVKSYWQEEKKVKLPYIELDQFSKIEKYIPHGSVLNIVRKNEDQYDVLISHQGLVIRSKEKVYFRHASINGKIRTVTLKNYLKNQKLKNWKILGFNLNQFK